MALVSVIFVTFLPILTHGALLGEQCQSIEHCATPYSICAPLASICSPYGSFCQCRPGFKEDRGRCKRISYYNETCGDIGDTTICANADAHLYCNTATARCECDIGYEPNFNNNDTTAIVVKCNFDGVRGQVGDSCTLDPIDSCGPNSECLDGTCSCVIGYQYDETARGCAKISLGDACIDDYDCVNVIGAICHNDERFCTCPLGFLEGSVTFKAETVRACLANTSVPKEIGEACSESGPNPQYCAQPFVCTKCHPNNSISICSVPTFLSTTQMPRTTTTTTTILEIITSVATEISTPSSRTSTTTVSVPTTTEYDYYEVTESNAPRVPSSTPRTTTTMLPGVPLGQDCFRNEDCGALFSYCSPEGLCRCRDGYEARGANECIETFERIALGRPCDPEVDYKRCGTPDAVCFNGTCRCRSGFKTGPEKNDCVENARQFGYGDVCSTSSECYYNLICLESKCQCSPGFRRLNNFECRKRKLEEACPSGFDIECRFIDNAVCNRDRYCRCASGFTRESDYSCTPLVIIQDSEDWSNYKVSCDKDSDCISPLAPKMSRCIAKTCNCPSNAIYLTDQNRCQYKAPNSDLGFACTYDRDCFKGSRCIRNTCGGTAPPIHQQLIAGVQSAKLASSFTITFSFVIIIAFRLLAAT